MQVLILLTTCPLLDVTSSTGIWATAQSAICIICCCAPVYRPLFPNIIWRNAASKICSYGSMLRSKNKRGSPGLQTGSAGQLASLDPFLQGEGHFHTGRDSTRCLVASKSRCGLSHSNELRTMGSTQPDSCVDIDCDSAHKTSDQRGNCFPEAARPSMPSPSHLRGLRVYPDVSDATHAFRAVRST